MGVTVAVAGAGGFIGSHIVQTLVDEGHEVVALDLQGIDLEPLRAVGALPRSVDLADGRAAREALAGCERVVNATGLFDLAAPPARLSAVNVGVTRTVLESAREAGVRRAVHLSSVAVYGLPRRCPMPEDGPLHPRGAYEQSKRAGEAAARETARPGFEVVVARPSLVYGPRSRYGQALLVSLAAQAQALGVRRLPVFPGGPRGHHVHVHDVARAVAILLAHPEARRGAFNVADDVPLGVGDSMVAVVRAVGLGVGSDRRLDPAWAVLRPVMRHLPAFALHRLNAHIARGTRALARRGQPLAVAPRLDPDWLAYFADTHIFDTGRLRALGFAPRHPDFRDAIGDVVAWYREAGWIPARDGAPQRKTGSST